MHTPESQACLDAAIKVLKDGGCGVEIASEETVADGEAGAIGAANAPENPEAPKDPDGGNGKVSYNQQERLL